MSLLLKTHDNDIQVIHKLLSLLEHEMKFLSQQLLFELLHLPFVVKFSSFIFYVYLAPAMKFVIMHMFFFTTLIIFVNFM